MKERQLDALLNASNRNHSENGLSVDNGTRRKKYDKQKFIQ